jgi:glucans biosynthesis protein C
MNVQSEVQSPPALPVRAAPERFHALDSLRGVAMLLGVFLHAAMAYVTIPFPWPGRDEHPHFGFDVFVGAVHGFRMQLFFFIAGFFAHLLYHRIGAAPFLGHRLKRIGIPFLAGLLVLLPGLQALVLVHPDAPEFAHLQLPLLAPMHLWFLEYLLILYAATLLGIAVFKRLVSEARWRQVDGWLGSLLRSFGKPFLLALPTAAILAGSVFWASVENSGLSLLPTWAGLGYYTLFYAVGWWVHRQPELLQNWTRHTGRYLALATVAFLVWGGLLGYHAQSGFSKGAAAKFVLDSAGALYSWLMVFGLTGLFVKRFNRSHPAVRYVADASYWIYLTHLPLVMFLQVLLQPYAWNVLLKFTVVNAATLLVLFGTYQWFVRYTFIGAILNGRKIRLEPGAP